MSVKLSPYEVWAKLGNPKKIVAPMVDHSDLAFRMMTRNYGADLVYTQMFNSNSFLTSREYREDNFTTCKEDRPLVIQFAGHDPETLLAAARLVEDKCDAVDINLGCPQGIAKRGRYGAFLMEELDLLDAMVRTMANGLKIPVTCKTRIYKDFDRSIKLCETLVNAGASVLTIHGRTRDEKGQLVRDCDFEMIRRIKQHFRERAIPVPIIANGGIETIDDVYSCIAYTGVDGVMSSEAILENPALFTRSLTRNGVYKNQIQLTEEYLHYCEQYPVWHIKCIRSHVMKMLYRYIAKHPDELRDYCGISHTISEFFDVCALARKLVEKQCSSNSSATSITSEASGNNSDCIDTTDHAIQQQQSVVVTREMEDKEYCVSWYRRYSRQTDKEAAEGSVSINPTLKSKKDRLLDLKTSFLRSTRDGEQGDDVWCLGEEEDNCSLFGTFFSTAESTEDCSSSS